MLQGTNNKGLQDPQDKTTTTQGKINVSWKLIHPNVTFIKDVCSKVVA
jgi:hypothetical protein